MVAIPSSLRRAAAKATLLGAALLAGCSLATDPDTTLRLTVNAVPIDTEPSPANASNVEITAGQRFIQGLGGLFEAPCLQANRAGHISREGNTITVRLVFSPNNASCNGDPSTVYDYDFYITNIDGGTYTVRVIHEGDGQVPDGTVVKETSVSVLPI